MPVCVLFVSSLSDQDTGQILVYLTKCFILTNNQYGFRSIHDTSMVVIEMVDKISEATDKGDNSIGIFIN